uniref:DUF19 domain-containing protein n=1 Tax=Steinernema glaseri TaxID=37863 RepID=A0A1I8A0U6_9BILA
MRGQLVCIFVALLGVSLAAKAATKNCDQPQLNHCSDTFLKFIGYNTTNYDLWKKYEPLYKYLTGKWTAEPGNAEGLVNICNGLEALLGCLGPEGYNLCTRTPYLVSMGTPLDEAYKVQGMLDQFNFQCGAGFFTALTENFQCLQRVEKHFSTSLDKCRNTFFVNVQADSSLGCAQEHQLVFCYMTVFEQAQCRGGTERADLWWACESQVAFTQPYNFCTAKPFDCSEFFDHRNRNAMLNSASSNRGAFDEWVQTHYKKTETGHLFKMADTYKMVNGKLEAIEGEWVEEPDMF